MTTREKGSTIVVGDMVIVKYDKVKKYFWKLAIVEQLIKGKDGHVQAAVFKVGQSNSSRMGVTIKRSIKHLYPIEVKADDTKMNLMRGWRILQDQRKLHLETITVWNPLALEKTGGPDVKQPFELN